MAIRPSQSYKKIFEMAVDATSVAAVTVSVQTFTTTEKVTTEDTVIVQPTASLSTGVSMGVAWVSATDTISIPFINPTAGAVDPASVTIKVIVL